MRASRTQAGEAGTNKHTNESQDPELAHRECSKLVLVKVSQNSFSEIRSGLKTGSPLGSYVTPTNGFYDLLC